MLATPLKEAFCLLIRYACLIPIQLTQTLLVALMHLKGSIKYKNLEIQRSPPQFNTAFTFVLQKILSSFEGLSPLFYEELFRRWGSQTLRGRPVVDLSPKKSRIWEAALR